MNIHIHGEHMKLTAALEEYIGRKIKRLHRYIQVPPDQDVYVTLSVVRAIQRVEVMFSVHGFHLRAEEKSEDMYISIDLVVDKLQNQIEKYKVKRQHRQYSAPAGHLRQTGGSATQGSWEDRFQHESEIVRVKQLSLKPMGLDEATLQMELLGHDFFMFTNADTNDTNLLYRRRDGKYGLIETK